MPPTTPAAAAAAFAAVVLLVAGGCSSSHRSSPGPTSSTSMPATTASTSAPSTTQATSVPTTAVTVPPTTAAASGPQPCSTSSLSGSLESPNGTAGAVYWELVLHNNGSTACTLEGYPGVSFVAGSNGQQVGAPATRITGTPALVTLAPGGAAQAELRITDAGNFGSGCGDTPTDGLRVYPPGQTASLLVNHSDTACANTSDGTLSVGALVPA